MKRTPEPELMEDPEQVLAYGRADFAEPHSRFVRLLGERCPLPRGVNAVLDMGCGAGDITFRAARAFAGSNIDAIDGSEPMLNYAKEALENEHELHGRIHFIHGRIEDYTPDKIYDLIISNSLLHHIPDPAVFWRAVKRLSAAGTRVFVMDLMRPGTAEEARRLVETYSPDEPDILKRDFYHSLLAAYELGEVKLQLESAGLGDLEIGQVSDRHLIVCGRRD
jgi:ubiquinone/menaquinone biosynthesis C-methylase UbiE